MGTDRNETLKQITVEHVRDVLLDKLLGDGPTCVCEPGWTWTVTLCHDWPTGLRAIIRRDEGNHIGDDEAALATLDIGLPVDEFETCRHIVTADSHDYETYKQQVDDAGEIQVSDNGEAIDDVEEFDREIAALASEQHVHAMIDEWVASVMEQIGEKIDISERAA
jgi:hypothetical protein